jgi:membrane protease YdiL (CAAX protease family)/predicted permease
LRSLAIARSLLWLKVRLLVRHARARGRMWTLLVAAYHPVLAWQFYDAGRTALGHANMFFFFLEGFAAALAAVGWVGWLLLMIVQELQLSFVMNLAQRSSDNDFLFALPVRLGLIAIVKACERLLTDLTLAPAIALAAALAFAGGGGWTACVAAVSAALATSFLMGIMLFLVHLALARRLSEARIRQVAFLLQPLAVLPFVVLVVAWPELFEMRTIASRLVPWLPYADWFPPYAFARGILGWNAGQAHRCLGPAAAIVAVLALLLAVAAWMQGGGSSYVAEQVAPGRPLARTAWPGRRMLRGFFWKDLLLLVRDFNLLGNALLLPVVFVLCLIFATGSATHGPAATPRLLAIATMFCVFYFNGFGALNSVGSEGHGFAVVRTLPVSTSGFLVRKAAFWSVLSVLVFAPLVLAMAWRARVPAADAAHTLGWLIVGSASLATLGVALSALFVDFEARVLQQGSTQGGKLIFLLLGGAFHQALVQTGWLDTARVTLLYQALFVCLLLAGARSLELRDDSEAVPRGRLHVSDALVFPLATWAAAGPAVAIAASLERHPGLATGPQGALGDGIGHGLAPIAAALLVQALVGWAAWRYVGARTGDARRATGLTRDGLRFAPVGGLIVTIGTVGLVVAASWLSIGAVAQDARAGIAPFAAAARVVAGASGAPPDANGASGSLLPSWLALALVLAVGPLAQELVFRGVLHPALGQAGWPPAAAALGSAAVFAAAHPWPSGVVAFAVGLALARLHDRAGSLAAVVLARVALTSALIAWAGLDPGPGPRP